MLARVCCRTHSNHAINKLNNEKKTWHRHIHCNITSNLKIYDAMMTNRNFDFYEIHQNNRLTMV